MGGGRHQQVRGDTRNGGRVPVHPKRTGEVLRQDAGELQKHIVPVTGPAGKLRDLCLADGFAEDDILTIPDGVGGRFSVFTAVGCCRPRSSGSTSWPCSSAPRR